MGHGWTWNSPNSSIDENIIWLVKYVTSLFLGLWAFDCGQDFLLVTFTFETSMKKKLFSSWHLKFKFLYPYHSLMRAIATTSEHSHISPLVSGCWVKMYRLFEKFSCRIFLMNISKPKDLVRVLTTYCLRVQGIW